MQRQNQGPILKISDGMGTCQGYKEVSLEKDLLKRLIKINIKYTCFRRYCSCNMSKLNKFDLELGQNKGNDGVPISCHCTNGNKDHTLPNLNLQILNIFKREFGPTDP